MRYGENELKIKVEKSELLAALEVNREAHSIEYERAKRGFRILLQKELEKKLQQCKDGKKVELNFKNSKPTNNLSDFDDVIGMLKLSTDTVIEIGHKEYKQWFKNEWDWSAQWSVSNMQYLSAALI